jgi:hypothetical protein
VTQVAAAPAGAAARAASALTVARGRIPPSRSREQGNEAL